MQDYIPAIALQRDHTGEVPRTLELDRRHSMDGQTTGGGWWALHNMLCISSITVDIANPAGEIGGTKLRLVLTLGAVEAMAGA
jgi:hypothetical protein